MYRARHRLMCIVTTMVACERSSVNGAARILIENLQDTCFAE